jgi:hypothetical protein
MIPMKTNLAIPFALALAAAPLCAGRTWSQEAAAPATPPPPPPPLSADAKTPEPPDTGGSRPGSGTGHEASRRPPVPFLGVNTSSLPDAVAAQLPLEKGTGLLVTYVEKNSPAEKAGLEANDVLVKLDDHLLVNTAQLRTVIDNRKEGDAVTLSFYRKGQEKTAAATLAAQERTPGHRWTRDDRGDEWRSEDFQSAMERAREEIERASVEARQAARTARGEFEKQRGDFEKQRGDWSASMSALREALKGVELPTNGLTTSFSNPGAARSLTVDKDGVFLLTRKEDTTHLRATDKTGKVVFDGDVTTPEQQAKVPAEFAAKLQKLLKDLPAEDEHSATRMPPAPPAPAAEPAAAAPPVPPAAPVPPAPPAPPAALGSADGAQSAPGAQ